MELGGKRMAELVTTKLEASIHQVGGLLDLARLDAREQLSFPSPIQLLSLSTIQAFSFWGEVAVTGGWLGVCFRAC